MSPGYQNHNQTYSVCPPNEPSPSPAAPRLPAAPRGARFSPHLRRRPSPFPTARRAALHPGTATALFSPSGLTVTLFTQQSPSLGASGKNKLGPPAPVGVKWAANLLTGSLGNIGPLVRESKFVA
jgi:hypothetical protein